MKSDNLISVIVPLYNKEKFIIRSIDSILNQSFNNFEVIVIDDGSTDGSFTIVSEQYSSNEKVRLISRANKGVSYTRNEGIKLSKGRYISFLDADDYWDENFLDKAINNISIYDTVVCNHVNVKNDMVSNNKDFKLDESLLLSYLSNKTTPNTNSWLIKKDLLHIQNIYFDEDINYGEDMLFFSKVIIMANKVICLDERLTYYNKDVEDSLTKIGSDIYEREVEWLKRLLIYIDLHFDDKTKKQVIDVINNYRLKASFIYPIYSKSFESPLSEEDKNYWYQNIHHFKKIEFSNGLRSIKLSFLQFKISLMLRRIK